MPTINPSLVPTIAPGNLFQALTTDSTLNVRWITPTDPVLDVKGVLLSSIHQ